MKNKIIKIMCLQMILILTATADIIRLQPFAIAFFTALFFVKEMRKITIVVSPVSFFLFYPGMQAVKYTILVITLSALFLICEKLFHMQKNIYIAGALAGILTTVMEWIDRAVDLSNPLECIILGLTGILIFTMTVIFEKAIIAIYQRGRQKVFRNEEMVSVALLCGVLVYGIGNISNLPKMVLPAVILFLITFFAYKYGAGMGGMVGALIGMVFVFKAGRGDLLGIFSMMGVIAGSFRAVGRISSLAGSVIVLAIAGIASRQELLQMEWLQGVILGGGIYLLLPSEFAYCYMQIEGMNDARLRPAQIRKDARLRGIAQSFEKLANAMWQLPNKKQSLTFSEMEQMVGEVSKKVCSTCHRYDECWNRGKYEAMQETSELFRIGAEKGMVGKRELNRQFFNKCKNVSGLVSEVNHLLEKARMNILWHNRLIDSKYAVATQLEEVSGIIKDYSKEAYDLIGIDYEREEWMRRRLKSKKIQLKKIHLMENRHGRMEVSFVVRSTKGICISTKEIEAAFFECFGKRIRTAKYSKVIIGTEFSTIYFVEDVNYTVLHGAAKCAKDKEAVSGDNFGFTTLSCGQMLMTISDGMGYGRYAYTESETVVELLEELLESGFKEESALKLVNLVMMLNSDAGDTATADMGVLDLYTGVCHFVKLGAAPTFIKRSGWVEVMKSSSLPLGVLEDVDFEKTTKKLYDGDMIIMVSDGVIDCLKSIDKEREMCELIQSISASQPKEFARELLARASQDEFLDAVDDKTVLVGKILAK